MVLNFGKESYMNILSRCRLSGNALKLFGALFMLIDHIGMLLFPSVIWLRAVGRLAFPIFAYMISEGAHRTRNKLAYFLRIFSVGVICQLVYFIYNPSSPYLNVMLTFSASVLLIYSLDRAKLSVIGGFSRREIALWVSLFVAMLFSVLAIGSFYMFDYGIMGILAPLFSSIFRTREGYPERLVRFDNKFIHVSLMSIPMIVIVAESAPVQIFSFVALILLLLYSGERGRWRMKYFFYVFYPVHLLILQLIAMLIA